MVIIHILERYHNAKAWVCGTGTAVQSRVFLRENHLTERGRKTQKECDYYYDKEMFFHILIIVCKDKTIFSIVVNKSQSFES